MIDVQGRHALKVSEGPRMGAVWLGGHGVAIGRVEADLRGRSQPVQGSFVGPVFNVVDARTHDVVY